MDSSSDHVAILIANGCHTYFLLKVADLMDTVFFVLRKKDNQITFLHLYHHTGMVVLTWNAAKFYPGGHSVFTGFINSIIHVVMYSYYLVSAFQPQYKNNLWWKKYITQMQIVSISYTFILSDEKTDSLRAWAKQLFTNALLFSAYNHLKCTKWPFYFFHETAYF